MDPVKAFYPLSCWLLRLAVLVIIYISFFITLKTLNLSSVEFYIASAFAVFGVLLFIGGFLNKSTLTVLSALMLMIGCLYKIVMHYGFDKGNSVALYFVFAAITMFFFSNGNKKK
jgi:hypothetical protein